MMHVTTKEKIVQVINLVVLIAIASFYLYRTISYRSLFERSESGASENRTLADNLRDAAQLDSGNFIKDDEGRILYTGMPMYNYVQLHGTVYRVMSVETDDRVRLIAQNVVTSLPYPSGVSFSASSIYSWLNTDSRQSHTGIYEQTLSGLKLSATPYADDMVNDLDNITENDVHQDTRVVLPSLSDYAATGGAKGYLNNGQRYWLVNEDEDGNHYVARADGAISIGMYDAEMAGVRPIISLDGNYIITRGNGSVEDPFTADAKAETINQVYIGQAISFHQQNWIVTGYTDDGDVEAALDGTLDAQTFGEGMFNQYEGLGAYLNGEWLQGITDYEKNLVAVNWYNGFLDPSDRYDYRDTYNSSVDEALYVGLPCLGDFDLANENGIWLLNGEEGLDTAGYTISDEGNLYSESYEAEAHVRPVVVFRHDLTILSGTGTSSDPYVVGGAQ